MLSILAIAAPTFSRPSETFIRDHVRMIAPGETALLCLSEDGPVAFDLPALSGLRTGWHSKGPVHRRLRNAVENRWRGYSRPGLSRSSRGRLLDFLGETQPLAVLAEYGPTGCFLLDACAQAGVPLFVHFHGYDASRLTRKWWWRRNYRRLFNGAAGIITPSRFLADRLSQLGCPEDVLHVSPNGVDPDKFVPTRRVPQRLITVGRLVEKKGPDLTIAAFAAIAERFPQATLDVVGDGPLMGRCRSLVKNRGLEKRIRFYGATSSEAVACLMREASVFVQHSVTARDGDMEGFGISLVEAMASEIPVVATRHNGFVETVEHGVSGFLVEEYDVEGMADAIASLLDDPARVEAMGKAGRRRVLAEFTQERSGNRLRAIMGLPPIAPPAGSSAANGRGA